jgi:hypothetical protein
VKEDMIMYFRVPANFGEPAPIPYSPPFPNIRAKSPNLYNAALRAEDTVRKLSWFKDVYFPLELATSSARLALDASDQVIVIPEPASVETLLGPKLIKAAFKQIGKSLTKELAAEIKEGRVTSFDLARAVAVLDLFWKFKSALELDEGRRLVSEQNRSRRDEAYRYKLRFFIRLRIAQTAPAADPVILAGRMEKAFWEYKKALGELLKYQVLEKNLEQGMPPYQRRAPTIGPVPPGL